MAPHRNRKKPQIVERPECSLKDFTIHQDGRITSDWFDERFIFTKTNNGYNVEAPFGRGYYPNHFKNFRSALRLILVDLERNKLAWIQLTKDLEHIEDFGF